MAEINGQAQLLVFAMYAADGTLAPGLTPSAEISLDGGAFAATTNAVVEISDGYYKLQLTAAEKTADAILVRVFDAGATETSIVLSTTTVTEASIADAVWEEALADHVGADTMGEAQNLIPGIDQTLFDTIVGPGGVTAKVDLTDDNAGTEDVYSVQIFRWGVPITNPADFDSGPTIWVYDQDGNDLIGTDGAPQALTQIGATASYKHVEAVNRIVSGVVYFARVIAFIGGESRVWVENRLGRDST